MGDIGTSSVSLAILCNYSSGVWVPRFLEHANHISNISPKKLATEAFWVEFGDFTWYRMEAKNFWNKLAVWCGFFRSEYLSWDDFSDMLPRGKRYDFYSLFKKKIIVEDDIHPNFRWSWSALWVALPGRVPSLRRLTLKQLQIPLPVSVLQLLGAVAGCGGGKVGDELCGASWRTCWKYYHSW